VADDLVSLAFVAWTYGHVLRDSDPDAAWLAGSLDRPAHVPQGVVCS